MGLAHVVATTTLAPRHTGLPCSIGALEQTLTGDDLDALYLILYGPTRQRPGRGRTQREVHDLLKAADLEVSEQQINRHRAGTCRCGDAA